MAKTVTVILKLLPTHYNWWTRYCTTFLFEVMNKIWLSPVSAQLRKSFNSNSPWTYISDQFSLEHIWSLISSIWVEFCLWNKFWFVSMFLTRIYFFQKWRESVQSVWKCSIFILLISVLKTKPTGKNFWSESFSFHPDVCWIFKFLILKNFVRKNFRRNHFMRINKQMIPAYKAVFSCW